MYFSVVRLHNSVVYGYWCNWKCGTLQVVQCSEITEQCGVWLLVLPYM
jgi:hypothetical protein